MTQTPTNVSSQSDRPASGYVLRVVDDTWLKLSTAQGSTLPDDQKQLIRAGTLLPVATVHRTEDNHLKVTLGVDTIGQKVHIRGRNTWYVYAPAVQILQNDQPIPLDRFPTDALSAPASSSSASTYVLRTIEDTWLKLSTAQGSTLPDNQKQFIKGGTVLPLSSFRRVENDHIRVAFGLDENGDQVQFQGRNTWYVYRPAVQVLRNGVVISLGDTPSNPPVPPVPAPNPVAPTYAVKAIADTWLKLSTAQSAALPDDQRQFVNLGTVLPIASYGLANNDHIKITLGRDSEGNQLQFKGRNTWYVYRPAIQVLRDGKVVALEPSIPPPAPPSPSPAPAPSPAPTPAPRPTPSGLALKTTVDTWLKASTAQSSTLLDTQRQFINAGTVLPVGSYALAENDHIRVSLGVDNEGSQVQFKGQNTWYVYRPAVQLLKDGKVIDLATSAGRRQINAKGLRLLKSFEGLRLEAYLDPVGIWTIGYGTTSGVYPGMRITEAQAEAFLRRDLARFENAVIDLVRVPLNDDQFSALVSFTYNVGEGALASSTLLRLLNRRDYQGAADQLLRWNKGDGGQELYGLTRRRRAERAMFLGQDYTAFL